jgi:hypothetical protein
MPSDLEQRQEYSDILDFTIVLQVAFSEIEKQQEKSYPWFSFCCFDDLFFAAS